MFTCVQMNWFEWRKSEYNAIKMYKQSSLASIFKKLGEWKKKKKQKKWENGVEGKM